MAPAARASAAAFEFGSAMTQMRISVLTGWGSRNRLRTTGPFLSVFRWTWISYLDEDGWRPTSNARMYLEYCYPPAPAVFHTLGATYCIASMSENCSARFRSYRVNVLEAFLFFFGCALVVAHRMVWRGAAARRGNSALVHEVIGDMFTLLSGASNDRGCAIVGFGQFVVSFLDLSKVHRRLGGAKLAHGPCAPMHLVSLALLQHLICSRMFIYFQTMNNERCKPRIMLHLLCRAR